MPFTVFGHTDTGRQRAANEDRFLCARLGAAHVIAVADGMGGHAGGKVASSLAIAALESQVAEADPATSDGAAWPLLEAAFRAANREILKTARADHALLEMGTTMVAAVVGDGGATFANLGDSRAYLVRRGVIGQVTVDHSWREEARQHNLAEEDIALSPFRETITRSLGIDEAVRLDLVEFGLEPGDCVLLCSDGIHDLVPELEIRATVLAEKTPERIGRKLVDLANAAGGHDNSTCVLIRYDGGGAGARGGS